MTAIAGFLSVGYNENGEVIVDHPDIQPDKNGAGHIVFSPQQARHLASLLVEKAAIADRVVAPPWQPTATFEARRDAAAKAIYAVEEPEFGPDATDARGYPRWGNYYEHAEAALRAAGVDAIGAPALPANVAALVERAREVATRIDIAMAAVENKYDGKFIHPAAWQEIESALAALIAALGEPQQEK